MIERIISGGQTGADRAALDWAIANDIPYGGWCPAGRMAEDGAIPSQYQLIECPGGYRQRTRWNVRDSDATLIVSIAADLTGGTLETRKYAENIGKPWHHVWPHEGWQDALTGWIRSTNIRTLNVAGPRASRESRVADFVSQVLDCVGAVRKK